MASFGSCDLVHLGAICPTVSVEEQEKGDRLN
jgi:hypothetical protein